MSEADPTWNELFALLGPIHDDVHLFARRIARSNADGDDLFQDAVLRAARSIGSLREREKFKSWMYSVVVSVHRSRCRRAFWKRLVLRESVPDTVGDDGARWEDERASASRASTALATLEPAQREAIVLFELHGYSIDEIAAVQAASSSAVKTRLVRGRDRLRRYYAGVGEPDSTLPTTALPTTMTPTEEVCRG